MSSRHYDNERTENLVALLNKRCGLDECDVVTEHDNNKKQCRYRPNSVLDDSTTRGLGGCSA